MTPSAQQDLAVLVPDKDMEATVTGLLARPQSFGIRPITHRVFVYADRDPGCLLRPHVILNAGLATQFAHALVMLDHDGCGREDTPRKELEADIVQRLHEAGWDDCVEAVIIAPELEAWVWSDSPKVVECLGWPDTPDTLHAWLAEHGLKDADTTKPADPKACVERIREHIRKPRSSAMYRALAEGVSTRRCIDPAFAKFRRVLQAWFPA